MNLNMATHRLAKNMVCFRGHNISFALGQSTQFCDKADYKARALFRSAELVLLLFKPGWTSTNYNLLPWHFFISILQTLYLLYHDDWTGKQSSLRLLKYFVPNKIQLIKMCCCGGLFGHVASLLSKILWGTSSCFVMRTVNGTTSQREEHQCIYPVIKRSWQAWHIFDTTASTRALVQPKHEQVKRWIKTKIVYCDLIIWRKLSQHTKGFYEWHHQLTSLKFQFQVIINKSVSILMSAG